MKASSKKIWYRNKAHKTKSQPKLTEQALANVQDGPSNIETYKEQDQNSEPASLGLEPRQKDMEAFCRDWDKRWNEASKK
jgi:hypothetical protein